jgi:hypothetical protein
MDIGFLHEDGLGSALSTLLAYTTPAEVLVPSGSSFATTSRRIQAITPMTQITKLPVDDSPAPHVALDTLVAGGEKYCNILKGIQQNVAEGDVPAVSAAVLPLLHHVERMCLEDKLQNQVPILKLTTTWCGGSEFMAHARDCLLVFWFLHLRLFCIFRHYPCRIEVDIGRSGI